MEGRQRRCPGCGRMLAIAPDERLEDVECAYCGAALAGEDHGPEAEGPPETPTPEAPDEPVAAELVEEPETSQALRSLRAALSSHGARKPGILKRLIWLGISVAVFVAVLGTDKIATTLLILVPVILLHELGHLAAMKLCGYKDVSVFFIPLLGAATAGREVRASQTKRAFVSLMGPLPGIVVGFVLLVAVGWASSPLLTTAIELLFLLNVFNLLPIRPLDGGRLLDAIVISRSAVAGIL